MRCQLYNQCDRLLRSKGCIIIGITYAASYDVMLLLDNRALLHHAQQKLPFSSTTV